MIFNTRYTDAYYDEPIPMDATFLENAPLTTEQEDFVNQILPPISFTDYLHKIPEDIFRIIFKKLTPSEQSVFYEGVIKDPVLAQKMLGRVTRSLSKVRVDGSVKSLPAIKRVLIQSRKNLVFSRLNVRNAGPDYSRLSLLFSGNFNSLTSLSLTNSNMSDFGFNYIVSQIPSLRSLTHLDVSNNAIRNIDYLHNLVFTKLNSLLLNENNIDDFSGVTLNTRLSSLTRLEVSDQLSFNDIELQRISHNTRLHSLKILNVSCTDVTLSGMRAFLNTHPQVESLDLSSFKDNNVGTLLSNFPNLRLKKLNLEDCKIGPRTVRLFQLSTFQNLVCLGVHAVNDIAFASIVDNLTLSHLKLYHTHLSKRKLGMLRSKSRFLKSLTKLELVYVRGSKFSNNFEKTRKRIRDLININELKQLSKFTLLQAEDGNQLVHIIVNSVLKNLRSLSVTADMTDTGFATISSASSLSSLVHLNLSRNAYATMQGVVDIGNSSHLKSLKTFTATNVGTTVYNPHIKPLMIYQLPNFKGKFVSL